MGSSLRGLCGPVRSKLVGCDHGLGLPAGAVVVREKNQHLVRPVPILVHLISRLSSHHVWSGLRLCLHAAFLYERCQASCWRKPTTLSFLSSIDILRSRTDEAACRQTPPLLRLFHVRSVSMSRVTAPHHPQGKNVTSLHGGVRRCWS